mmetsp:Transcript_13380/g.46579  ORF Transcript_13380/g.46579 Transcript_13380/m.46579 type:complete len:279 (+) Transcript_13380:340-1176(+)
MLLPTHLLRDQLHVMPDAISLLLLPRARAKSRKSARLNPPRKNASIHRKGAHVLQRASEVEQVRPKLLRAQHLWQMLRRRSDRLHLRCAPRRRRRDHRFIRRAFAAGRRALLLREGLPGARRARRQKLRRFDRRGHLRAPKRAGFYGCLCAAAPARPGIGPRRRAPGNAARRPRTRPRGPPGHVSDDAARRRPRGVEFHLSPRHEGDLRRRRRPQEALELLTRHRVAVGHVRVGPPEAPASAKSSIVLASPARASTQRPASLRRACYPRVCTSNPCLL